MLKIRAGIVQDILAAKTAEDLYKHLQAAIELEHSTIPPYLTALYSIKLGYNQEAYGIIRSVVEEEMLHMVIAANVLNAIGGHPKINDSEFIPVYPGPLPMNVGEGLIVGLAPLSKDVIKDTFMKIEEPDKPLDFPTEPFLGKAEQEEYKTIGDFYQAIIKKIEELGQSCFTGNPDLQVVNEQWFPSDQLFRVTKVDEAVMALTLIVKQGEGTEVSPDDPENNFAHYYRFAQIDKGRCLRPDLSVPNGYSYSGKPIQLDTDGIWDLKENSKAEDYQEGTVARRLVDQFNYSYTSLLNALHETLNGHPDRLNTAMGLMYELKLQAQKMVELQDPRLGKQVAPAFEYVKVPVYY